MDHARQLKLIDQRDAQDWADKLAYAIAPQSVIGEHSNSNNPWANALEIATQRPAETPEPTAEAEPAAHEHLTQGRFPYRQAPHRYAGSNSERQSVGDPGHCEDCCSVGHVVAHPDLGCGDVGCEQEHGDDSCVSALETRSRPPMTGTEAEPLTPHAKDLRRGTDDLADALVSLGNRVRLVGNRFARLSTADSRATSVVADIANDVTQGAGALGPLLWTLIRDAAEYDSVHRAQYSQKT